MSDEGHPTTVREAQELVMDMQSDWFISEVKRCVAIGMPLGCCEEWPECSHILAWTETL